jgi:glycosyltransferase 2 family protein
MLSRETWVPLAGSFSKGQGAILALKVAVTLGCLLYLFRHIDVGELRRTLPGLETQWVVIAVLLLVLQIPLVALRWLEIVRVLKMPTNLLTYPWMTAAAAVGQFFGQILPVIAGDGVRVWLLARFESDWRDAAISVAIDRCIGIGLLLTFAFAIMLLPSTLGLFGEERGEVIVVLGVMILTGLMGLVLGPRVSTVLATWRHAGWLAAFCMGANRAVFGPRSITILGVGCLIHVLTIAAIWSLGRAQGLAVSPADAAVLFAVMVGIALVPFSIGGWGLRELAMVSVFGNYGLTPERALVFSMYFGLSCVLASLPGALVWFGFLVSRPRRSSECGR